MKTSHEAAHKEEMVSDLEVGSRLVVAGAGRKKMGVSVRWECRIRMPCRWVMVIVKLHGSMPLNHTT